MAAGSTIYKCHLPVLIYVVDQLLFSNVTKSPIISHHHHHHHHHPASPLEYLFSRSLELLTSLEDYYSALAEGFLKQYL